ncbi:MAG: hypothetical protein HQL08_08665 [Nitrospirae bacterium]|nr:hypothetical protein [Nitrospirota bacterium]
MVNLKQVENSMHCFVEVWDGNVFTGTIPEGKISVETTDIRIRNKDGITLAVFLFEKVIINGLAVEVIA